MKLSIKHGVRLTGIRPELTLAATVVATVFWKEFGKECVITSALDGDHRRKSHHYKGLALDFRTRHIPQELLTQLAQRVDDSLGPEFDVVLETNHLHVEFDPP